MCGTHWLLISYGLLAHYCNFMKWSKIFIADKKNYPVKPSQCICLCNLFVTLCQKEHLMTTTLLADCLCAWIWLMFCSCHDYIHVCITSFDTMACISIQIFLLYECQPFSKKCLKEFTWNVNWNFSQFLGKHFDFIYRCTLLW